MRKFLELKNLTTTEYNERTNSQAEIYIRKLAARLHHDVGERQHNWDIFEQPPNFVITTQIYRSTGTIPFNLVLKRHASGPATFNNSSALPTYNMNPAVHGFPRMRLLYEFAVMQEKRIGS